MSKRRKGNAMERKGKPEILSPAGNFEVLKAAVYAGADAVYIGGTQFNARMNAKNFDRQTIKEAVEFCHQRGVKLYVTLNTLIYDRQMKDALEFAGFLYKTGVDALIVADLGLASLIRESYPDVRLHASTQCSGHNSDAAKFLANLGFSRMVCARELSEENIRLLTKNSPIEIEAFVHGALCVSQSGQCLMSSLIGGRSGNRGECAQPCRLPYNGRYPLSLKDNCLAAHVTKLIEMGVSALKIEGRMKSADYVYSVVSLYRRLVDDSRNATAGEINDLMAVFSRQGFTDGYFTGRIDEKMLGIRSESDKQATKSASVNIVDKGYSKEPIVKEEIQEVLVKCPPFPKSDLGRKKRSARFYKIENIPDIARDYFEEIYLPLDRFQKGAANGVVLPPVIPENEMEKVKQDLEKACKMGARFALVGNIGHIEMAKNAGLEIRGDYRLNVYNSFSADLFTSFFKEIMLSPELILPQIRDIKCAKSVIVYGKQPVMTLEKPVKTEILKDRRGISFPVVSEGGREIVLNSVPTYMADYSDRLSAAGIENMHFIFTDEGKRGSEAVIKAYIQKLPTKKEIRRIK